MQSLRNVVEKLLGRGEGLIGLDLRHFTKGGSWLMSSQFVAMLAGFLISLAFANLFSKESFGTYKFVLTMAGVVGAISLTGIGSAITQSVAKGFNGALRQGFRINMKWSGGMVLAGLGLATYYYLNGNTILTISFVIAGILLPIITSANFYGSYLLGTQDFQKSALYSMVRNVVPAIAIIVALLLEQGILVIVVVYFVSNAGISLILYYIAMKSCSGKDEDPELLSYGGHLSAMDFIGQIAFALDKILIFHFLGAIPLAIYAFAIAPVEQLQSGKKILSSMITPRFSDRSFEELQETTPKKVGWLTLYAVVLILVWVFLAPYFYRIFYPQYLDSVFYSQIYSLTLFAIVGAVFNETLVAHKRKRELYFHRTIIPVIRIILFLVLLPTLGLLGLIYTHIIAKFSSVALGYYFVKHPIIRAGE